LKYKTGDEVIFIGTQENEISDLEIGKVYIIKETTNNFNSKYPYAVFGGEDSTVRYADHNFEPATKLAKALK